MKRKGVKFTVKLKGMNCYQKDMWDLTCLLQLLTWLHMSDYHNFRNDESLSLLLRSAASFNCFTEKPLSKWR